jgi:hypothetical protein
MLSNRLKISDTLTMLSNRLKISDTSNMLSPYRRTTTIIQQSEVNGLVGVLALKVNIGDTSAMLSNRLKISDTLTMLSNYARLSGANFSGNVGTTGEFRANPSSGNATLRLLTASTERAAIKANAAKFFIEVGTFGERFSINNSTGLLTHTGAATITDVLNATGEITSGSASRAFLRQTVGGDVEVGSKAGGTTAIWSNNTPAVTFGLTQAATFVGSVKSAGLIQPISLKTANYTLTTNDHTVIFNTASGNLTATLPAGIEGQIYVLRKSVYGVITNDLIITPNGSQTIEGASGYTIDACSGEGITIQFLGGNWYIIGKAFFSNPC